MEHLNSRCAACQAVLLSLHSFDKKDLIFLRGPSARSAMQHRLVSIGCLSSSLAARAFGASLVSRPHPPVPLLAHRRTLRDQPSTNWTLRWSTNATATSKTSPRVQFSPSTAASPFPSQSQVRDELLILLYLNCLFILIFVIST